MKLQICWYSVKGGPQKPGVACVKEFGVHDVHWIVGEDGKKVTKVWSYGLIDGPLCYASHELVGDFRGGP